MNKDEEKSKREAGQESEDKEGAKQGATQPAGGQVLPIGPANPSSAGQPDWVDLYKIAVEQERDFLKEHQVRIKFFVGILSALATATATGVFYAGEKPDLWLTLLFGPALMMSVSYIARRACRRVYQRFLEVVTVMAKLEHRLGLDCDPPSSSFPTSDGWFKTEAIVPKRHLREREWKDEENKEKWLDSEKWVKDKVKHGYSFHIDRLFLLFFLLNIIASGLILYKALKFLHCI